MIVNLYRKLLPLFFRTKVYNFVLGDILFFKRNFDIILKSKFIAYFFWILPKTEENKAYRFMGKYGLTSYPYPYMLEHKNKTVSVEHDLNLNLPFIIHNNKKLYFKATSSDEEIVILYKALTTEQDERAAHRYVRSYEELKGRTLLDVGSAEGIFSLHTIEFVNHIYLFEYDPEWVKPLMATFVPWKDKVTLIPKYIDEKTDDISITLDDFLRDKQKENLFIKMDIEGAERRALNGAKETLKNVKNLRMSVTTYHQKNDPEFISEFVSKYGLNYEFSDGLMYWRKKLSKGIIRIYN